MYQTVYRAGMDAIRPWLRPSASLMSTVILACITLLLAGCGPYMWMFTEDQSFSGRDSLILEEPRADILDAAADAGRSLGYHVSSFNKEAGTLTLSSSTGTMTTVFTGKISYATLSVFVIDAGRKLDISVNAAGNFGSGGQEQAMSLVNDFKVRLVEKLKSR